MAPGLPDEHQRPAWMRPQQSWIAQPVRCSLRKFRSPNHWRKLVLYKQAEDPLRPSPALPASGREGGQAAPQGRGASLSGAAEPAPAGPGCRGRSFLTGTAAPAGPG